MASSNKYMRLRLNHWGLDDKPHMDDYNEDNRVIDEAFTEMDAELETIRSQAFTGARFSGRTLYFQTAGGEEIHSLEITGGTDDESTVVWKPNVDENGVLTWTKSNAAEIPAARIIHGTPGLSAYESALEGGYRGSEIEFYNNLAALEGADIPVTVNNIEQVNRNITLSAEDIPLDDESFEAESVQGALSELCTDVENNSSIAQALQQQLQGLRFVTLTQAAYDGMDAHDSQTLYIIAE